jgi:hypothetical protein
MRCVALVGEGKHRRRCENRAEFPSLYCRACERELERARAKTKKR